MTALRRKTSAQRSAQPQFGADADNDSNSNVLAHDSLHGVKGPTSSKMRSESSKECSRNAKAHLGSAPIVRPCDRAELDGSAMCRAEFCFVQASVVARRAGQRRIRSES